MSALALISKYTYEDYKEWEDRWELIDGIPYAMAPAPYPKHQKIIARMWRELDKNLKCIFKRGCEVYISPVDWKINDSTVVQPDVAIFCEKVQRQYFSTTPLLIVEVLSRSTMLKDTTVKFDLYEKQRVGCYIMIEPTKQQVEIYELRQDKYQLIKSFKDKGEYSYKKDDCEIEIDFTNVFD